MRRETLWSLDSEGFVYQLSSWNDCWIELVAEHGKVKRFKKITASQWCLWAIGFDDQLYLYVLKSNATMRYIDTIYESERKTKRLFVKDLRPGDPPNVAYINEFGKVTRCSLVDFSLPSRRWTWEDNWTLRRSYDGKITDSEGWLYSNSFSHLPLQTDYENSHHYIFNSQRNYAMSATSFNGNAGPNKAGSTTAYLNPLSPFNQNQVRQRQWKRYRFFSATNRWLLIPESEETFVISTNATESVLKTLNEEIESDPDTPIDKFTQSSWGIKDICCGGEMMAHQKDGHVSLWGVSMKGEVLYRHNIHRQNPEGENWCVIKLPMGVIAESIQVGSLGHILVCDNLGQLLFRDNISWKNCIGSTWRMIDIPTDLLEPSNKDEVIVKGLLSAYGFWVVSNKRRLWKREHANLHTENSNNIGRFWNLIYEDVSPNLTISMTGELWSMVPDSNKVLYKFVKETDYQKCPLNRFWNGCLDIGHDGYQNSGIFILKHLSVTGSFSEMKLPELWIMATQNRYAEPMEDINWYAEIIESLVARDDREYKNPQFSHLTAATEQVSWSKSSSCQVSSMITPISAVESHSCFNWVTAYITLHLKIKEDSSEANTLHIEPLHRDRVSTKKFISFVKSSEIICASKVRSHKHSLLSQSCDTMVIVLQNSTNYRVKILNNNSILPRLYLNFENESQLEDWLIAINSVSIDKRKLVHKADTPRAWILNQLHEPFCAYAVDGHENKWYQDGGHFRLIESGDHGRQVFAVSFNGAVWANTGGYGGAYLGANCTFQKKILDHNSQTKNKPYINPISDQNYVYATEYQKMKLFSGGSNTEYQPYMYLNENQEVIEDLEKHLLPTKRWNWAVSGWMVDCNVVEDIDREGWQYAASITQKFDSFSNRNKKIRRKFWKKQYLVSTNGPWVELSHEKLKIRDISITPKTYCNQPGHKSHSIRSNQQNYFFMVLAVTEEGHLLRRKGVNIFFREGIQWVPIKVQVSVTNVSMSQQNRLCIVCDNGHVWRLKHNVEREVTKIANNEWDIIKHPYNDRKFTKCSTGDNHSMWAVDNHNELWTMYFEDGANKPSKWFSVQEEIMGVSAASFTEVWAVFTNGNVARRTEISLSNPKGVDWSYKIRGVGTYVSCRGI